MAITRERKNSLLRELNATIDELSYLIAIAPELDEFESREALERCNIFKERIVSIRREGGL
jgi:hypothetical protein